MKIGVVLPTFSSTPEGALEVAARASAAGLDGEYSTRGTCAPTLFSTSMLSRMTVPKQ